MEVESKTIQLLEMRTILKQSNFTKKDESFKIYKEPQEAKKWYKKASKNGNKIAQDILDRSGK